jgi:hypothetical protein
MAQSGWPHRAVKGRLRSSKGDALVVTGPDRLGDLANIARAIEPAETVKLMEESVDASRAVAVAFYQCRRFLA